MDTISDKTTEEGAQSAAAERQSAAPHLRLRVFLASPGDVTDERALARKVLEALPYDPLLSVKVSFEIVAWDQPGAGVPMSATMTPQAAIEAGLPKPSECDIVVAIFWSRMGTPLPLDKYHKADGSPYHSGTEWEYLDALEAAEQGGKPDVLVYRRMDACPLFRTDREFHEKVRQQELVEAFFAAFRNLDGSIKRGCNEYVQPEDFRRQLDQHLRAIIKRRLVEGSALEARPDAVALPLWQGSPFPGLRAFTPDDAPIFFGRGRETDELVRRFADASSRFVAVVGASGSGKSSIAAAGLLPRLQDNAIVGSKDWLLPHLLPARPGERKQWAGLRFTPGEMGENPFLALATKLAPLLPDDTLTPGKVAVQLESRPEAITRLAETALGNQPEWAELLMFVDQFEELFSVVAERYRAPFLALLAAVTQAPRLRTIVTLRADFYHRCLEWPTLAELLRNATFPLAAPGPTALLEMISRPAARAGLEFDDRLPGLVLTDTGTDPGALALLAFALHELYDAKTARGKLTHGAYESFGGVKGAISKRAESTLDNLPQPAKAQLGHVFRELVEVNALGVATRRRAELARVAPSPEARALVDAFTDARLLVTDRGTDKTPMVDVAHEALLREWPRLADWIRSIADDLRVVRQAEAAAGEWERSGKYPSHLWPHERLVLVHEALTQIGTDPVSLAEPAKSFLRPEAERLLEEIERLDTTHYRRAEIGDRLDRIGDPRRGVGLRADGLPDIVWCEVPGGTVSVQGTAFEVVPFRIAKYPVTYRQYRAFVDDPDGYRQRERWWQGLKHEAAPGEQYRQIGNCPADNVSWYDAMAFCRWLDARLRDNGVLPLGRQVRLPTEWEWQQAATGGRSNYEYPWGAEWDARRTNTFEGRLGRTTAVGMYPNGGSVQAALDLAGNVEEWCLYEHDPPSEQVLRGGSWENYHEHCRCALRNWHSPVPRFNSVGFRVCCAPPIF